MGKWENLPEDLLVEIEKVLILYADKVRIRSVCKSWKYVLPKMPNLRRFQLPWLLLPCKEGHPSTFALFSVSEKKTYYLDLPKTEPMWFRGSSYGWVVVLEGHDEIYLSNPLTGTKIQLPSRSKFPDVVGYCADNHDNEYSMLDLRTGRRFDENIDSYQIMQDLSEKFFLSSDPSLTDDYVVVAIYGEFNKLAYWKHGDCEWTTLPTKGQCFQDVSFYQGRIYAVRMDGMLETIDNINPHRRTEDVELIPPYPPVREPPYRKYSYCVTYLVESSGELLLVVRQVELTKDLKKLDLALLLYKTVNFNVFKLDHSSSQWSRVIDIGDNVIFIGYNTSASISSLEFPGLKRNSIYFTDNLFYSHRRGILGGSEIGVFHLGSKTIEPLPGYKCDSNFVHPPPIWVTPSAE